MSDKRTQSEQSGSSSDLRRRSRHRAEASRRTDDSSNGGISAKTKAAGDSGSGQDGSFANVTGRASKTGEGGSAYDGHGRSLASRKGRSFVKGSKGGSSRKENFDGSSPKDLGGKLTNIRGGSIAHVEDESFANDGKSAADAAASADETSIKTERGRSFGRESNSSGDAKSRRSAAVHERRSKNGGKRPHSSPLKGKKRAVAGQGNSNGMDFNAETVGTRGRKGKAARLL